MKKYPHIEALGVNIVEFNTVTNDKCGAVSAEELERALADAPTLQGEACGNWFELRKQEQFPTFSYIDRQRYLKFGAKLLCIRPIEQESEERKLLREFVENWKNEWAGKAPRNLFERAKKCLGGL